MFGDKDWNNEKVTRRDLNYSIDNLKNWSIKGIEDDQKNMAQLLSMLLTELGYSANMRRGETVTLTKNKKK